MAKTSIRDGRLVVELPHTEDFDELLVSAPEEIAAAFETVSP